MAYISTEEVRAIRKALKAKFPKYKFGIRKRHHSSISVRLIKGPALVEEKGVLLNEDVNHYWLEKFYPKNAALFADIVKVIKTAPAEAEGGRAWFDNSDPMVDYFHTAFYFNLSVGEYGKDYEIVS